MLGQRSRQKGLFEADTQFLDFVGRDSFYAFLAAQRGQLFRDEDFAGLYNASWGRPSVPPSLLATALVLQTYDSASDEEARQRACYDLRWKVALGIELDTRPFAKSTLQEFRAQLVLHEEQQAIFQRSLELARRKGHFKGARKLKLALDTTNILGRGAVKDTYNLLADGIVLVLRALAWQAGLEPAAYAEAGGYGRYLDGPSLKGQAEIEWDDAAQRRAFLAGIVTDADRLLEEVRVARGQLEEDSPEDRRLADAAGLLSRVLHQDIERREDGPDLRDGVARDRMPSVHDPEMRHGRKSKAKRFDGHKLQLAVDTDSQLITAVAVLAGNAPDREQALRVVEESEALTGCAVEATLGDTAYGDGATRQQFADAGRTLIAKVPPASNQGYFPKTAFAIDLEAQTCRCPSGQVSRDLRPRAQGDGIFRFAAAVCAACPLRPQCVRGRGGRSVQLHAQEALLQAARAFQSSAAFRASQTLRQTAEHRLARLVQLGIRQARYRGTAKTLFQAFMAATVANLTLLAAGSGADLPLFALGACLIALLVRHLWRPGDIPPLRASDTARERASRSLACETATSLKLAPSRPGF
ncbi:MAG: IS1182 family transposase [Acidobacteria bacterium]|nr:IS1182 family transposase [Acidobacteriota bacterium]